MNDHIFFSREGNIYIGFFLFPVLAVFSYSYNYHAIWLVYDLVAFFLLCFFIFENKTVSYSNTIIFLAIISYFIVQVLVSSHKFMVVLSLWDTFKHLVFFHLFIKLNKIGCSDRNVVFSGYLYKFIAITFYIQIIVVSFQYINGVHFDDIAGTFGDGASHAIAYFSLLMVVVSVIFFKKKIYLLPLLILIIFMNVVSENVGFFVLIGFLAVPFFFQSKQIDYKMVIIIFMVSGCLYFILSLSFYSEQSFFDVITSRVWSMFQMPDHFDSNEVHGRSSYLFLASQLGGWFGDGPGAYSNIYLGQGYKISNLIDPQININEVSHIIAESGFVGLLFTLCIYIYYINKLFHDHFLGFFMIILFVCSMFYTALLMNESHIFLLSLVFYFFMTIEKTKCKNEIILVK